MDGSVEKWTIVRIIWQRDGYGYYWNIHAKNDVGETRGVTNAFSINSRIGKTREQQFEELDNEYIIDNPIIIQRGIENSDG